ncbi:MAG TPA: glycosyltransferase family A protein [Anaerolineales bacterium]
MTEAVRCSVVIRAYNESEHLGRLLDGIAHQSFKDVELILVDSGSTDGTVSIAESYGARIVRIEPDEFTFGRSLNLGMQAASAGLVVIASAHVYPVYPDWIERLLQPFARPEVAVVYGKQRGAAASRFSEHQIFRQWFPDADIEDQSTPFCNNANLAVRRSLWEQHAYDETVTGLEDVAWAKWAQTQGGRVVYAAHAEVIHVHHETAKAVYNRYRREGMAFKRIFPESHFSIYDFARLTLTNAFNDLLGAGRGHVLGRSLVSVVWFRLAQFWGTYQGYRHSSPVTQELRQRFYYPAAADSAQAGRRDIRPIRYNEAAPGQGKGNREED